MELMDMEMDIDIPIKVPLESRWSDSDTNRLIQLYNSLIKEVGQRFTSKKEMWDEISSNFSNKTAAQCDNRFKTVLRRKRKKSIINDSDCEASNDGTNELQMLGFNAKGIVEVTGAQWSDGKTVELLKLYKNFIKEVGPQKRFTTKMEMWNEISSYFPGKTGVQCNIRFKTVLRRKCKSLNGNFIKKKSRNNFEIETSNHASQETQFLEIPPQNVTKCEVDIKPEHNIDMWSEAETKRMMFLYKSLITQVGPQKRFTKIKDMWLEISKLLRKNHPEQCEARFRHLFNRNRKGYSVISILYIRNHLSEEDIFKDDNESLKSEHSEIPTIEIEETLSDTELDDYSPVKNKRNIKEERILFITDNAFKDEQDKSIQKTLTEMAAKREESSERRHRESMDIIENMINVMQQLIDNEYS